MSSKPRIVSRAETKISPWVRLVTKEVQFAPGRDPEIYHCLAQADYISIFAVTPDGNIPIIKQYRPAVETFTFELPAGLVEAGEDPEQTCRRELREEAGLRAESIVSLGTFYTDTGRLENLVYAFYVRASEPDPAFTPEDGLSVEFVSPETLRHYIRTGVFKHQMHLGVLAVAALGGYWMP